MVEKAPLAVTNRFSRSLWFLLDVLLAPAALVASAWAQQQNGVTPGELRSYATLHSIGIEWDITGDANHNANCPVQYRAQGAAQWKASR